MTELIPSARSHLRSSWLADAVLLAIVVAVIWCQAALQRSVWNMSRTFYAGVVSARLQLVKGNSELPPAVLDPDTFYWKLITHEIGRQGRLRIRHLPWDNAPWGRPNNWFMGLPWVLGAATHIAATVAGCTPDDAFYTVGPFINPAILTLLAATCIAPLCRRIGRVWAVLLVAAVITNPAVLKDGSWARVDHHLLVDALATLFIYFLYLGTTASTSQKSPPGPAVRWFRASGIVGGLGLWVQAVVFLPLIGSVMVAALLVRMRRWRPSASLPWMAWARAGSATSMLCYLVEFFPSPMRLTLEVNHPLYALFWLAGGYLLRQISQLPPKQHGSGVFLRLAPLLAAMLMPALLAILGPPNLLVIRDPLIRRLHACIGEFQPFFSVFHTAPIRGFLFIFGIMPWMAAAALIYLISQRAGHATIPLIVCLVPALAAFSMALSISRFSGLFVAGSFPLAAATVQEVFRKLRSPVENALRWVVGVAVVLIAGINLWMEQWQLPRTHGSSGLHPAVVRGIYLRDAARELGNLLPPAARVMAGFDIAAYLQEYAGVKTTGALYWENYSGLRDTVRFFAAYQDQEAEQILRKRGISYVVIRVHPEEIKNWHYCAYGFADPAGISRSLAYRLATGKDVPAWLVPVSSEAAPLATRLGFKLYRFMPPQRSETAATSNAV